MPVVLFVLVQGLVYDSLLVEREDMGVWVSGDTRERGLSRVRIEVSTYIICSPFSVQKRDQEQAASLESIPATKCLKEARELIGT